MIQRHDNVSQNNSLQIRPANCKQLTINNQTTENDPITLTV